MEERVDRRSDRPRAHRARPPSRASAEASSSACSRSAASCSALYLGARFGPSLVGGDQARWLPLFALGDGDGCSRRSGRRLGGYGRPEPPTGAASCPARSACSTRSGGGLLGAAIGPRALLGRRRRAPLPPGRDRAPPLRPGLDDPLDAQRGVSAHAADRHARAHRPVRRRSPARRPVSTRPTRRSSTPPASALRRSASCA